VSWFRLSPFDQYCDAGLVAEVIVPLLRCAFLSIVRTQALTPYRSACTVCNRVFYCASPPCSTGAITTVCLQVVLKMSIFPAHPCTPLHTKDRHLRIGVTAKMIALKGPDGTPVFESIAITLVRRTARPLPTRKHHAHSCGCKSRVQVCEECLKSEHPEKYVSNLNRSQPASQPADNVHTQTHTTIPPKGALTSSPKCRGGFRAPKLRSFERCSQRCAQTLAPSRSHAYDTRIDVVHRTRP